MICSTGSTMVAATTTRGSRSWRRICLHLGVGYGVTVRGWRCSVAVPSLLAHRCAPPLLEHLLYHQPPALLLSHRVGSPRVNMLPMTRDATWLSLFWHGAW